jgi:hypothetical protein
MLGARQLADLDWVRPCLQHTGDRRHGDGLGVLSAQRLGHGAQGLGSPARGRCCYVDARRRRPLLAGRERAGLLDARAERCAGADRRNDGWPGVLDRRNDGTERNEGGRAGSAELWPWRASSTSRGEE